MTQDAWNSRRVLVTAGPTHEPIDAVRYIGNRSSGRMGVAIARSLAKAGASVRLLLGPGVQAPEDRGLDIDRFTTAESLGALLKRHQPWAEMIIMAAAVADFTPKVSAEDLTGKWKRETRQPAPTGNPGSQAITLELIPTPDLLAACSARRAGATCTWGAAQRLVGFALEPRDRLLESARAKLARKDLDAIIANPLETMDSPDIEATLIMRAANGDTQATAAERQSKNSFADWLVDQLGRIL